MAYLFNTPEDQRQMLSTIGVGCIEDLFAQIPPDLRLNRPLNIPSGMTEMPLTQHATQLASRNLHTGNSVCFLGAGAYDHFIPAVVDAIASRGEFYTSYTPYQPEVSQGNLQVMFEYETLICQLTGMDVSNASLYDGASATIEAVLLALAAQSGRSKVVVCDCLHPQYREVLATYLQWTKAELVVIKSQNGVVPPEAWKAALDEQVACVVLSQPNFFGVVEDLQPAAKQAKEVGAVVVAVADMISLGLLSSPSEWGADIVVGEGQVLGNPLQYGGPYLGIMACRENFVRRMPGRIAGQTEDRHGKRCWVLTLQTREQHIRREKATSNICTNQGLFALRAAIYLSLLGPQGLRETAEHCAWKTEYLKSLIANSTRFELRFDASSWREIVIRDRQGQVQELIHHAASKNVLAGVALGRFFPQLDDCLLVAVTEKRSRQEIDQLVQLLETAPSASELVHA